MSTSNVVGFPKEKQQTQLSVLQKAKKVYDEALQEYMEQCMTFRKCPNLRSIVHHKRMVEASDTYLEAMSTEIVSQKNIFLKAFTFARFSGERAKVAKLKRGAQAEANKPQF